MSRKPGTIFLLVVVVLCAGVTGAPIGAFGQMQRANVITVEGAKTTYLVRDMGGKLVQAEVPSQSTADIRTNHSGSANGSNQSAPDAGTILAQVVAVDTRTDTVKVLTEAGQTIALEMLADDIQVGEQMTLVVPRRP